MPSKENEQQESSLSTSVNLSESGVFLGSEQLKSSDKLNSTFPLSNVEHKVFLSAKQQYIVFLGKQIGETKLEISKLEKQKREVELQLQKDIKKKTDFVKKKNELLIEIEDFKSMMVTINKQIAEIQEKIRFYKQSESIE